MKYGQQLERDSIPEWSLRTSPCRTLIVYHPWPRADRQRTVDNLDYNSLKHEIKVHTTRDQASAMAIPGHQDQSLRKFEQGLYHELCQQHDRVNMFIMSKADEILRRIGTVAVKLCSTAPWTLNIGLIRCHVDHLAMSVRKWVKKSGVDCESSPRQSLKHHRKFAKYERDLLRCGDDIQNLIRFSNTQSVAFRKILKKYKVRTLPPLPARVFQGHV